jgi:hypothetical protein
MIVVMTTWMTQGIIRIWKNVHSDCHQQLRNNCGMFILYPLTLVIMNILEKGDKMLR